MKKANLNGLAFFVGATSRSGQPLQVQLALAQTLRALLRKAKI